jgi:hypothetical protein
MSKYCFDSSSLIEAWVRAYPRDAFPTFWERFQQATADETILCPADLLREVGKKEDGLAKWAKKQKGMLYPLTPTLMLEVRSLLRNFPRFVEEGKDKNRGDPFVICLAKITDRCVVTEEGMAGNLDKPKIPDICQHYGLRWINLIGFIREQGWKF